MRAACLGLLLAASCRSTPPQAREQVRYLRQTARGLQPECRFELEPEPEGWTIRSYTGKFSVIARYGAGDEFLEALAALGTGEPVLVSAAAGRARVLRIGQPDQVFDVPPDVILTSAPDWSDVFRMARRWSRHGPARQEFPGLWIHPVLPAQRLTFRAERLGVDVLDGLPLERLRIHLRGDSPYLAWVDPAGRLIKLLSLPFTGAGTVLLLEGFEASASRLKPD